jgi:gluconolactonase
MMRKSVTVLAEGIGQPEGPMVLPDGRIVFTNTYRGEIVAWDAARGVRPYAHTGGAPNSCLLGADGLVYIANCPTAGSWVAPDVRPPCIQRATSDGRVEIVATHADGVRLDGPNDLCFGPDGRLYFTDSGDYALATKPHPGRICVIETNGTARILEELDHTYPNGIVAEADGSIVWVESYTRRMIRRRPNGDKATIHVFAENHIPDGFKIDAKANFWVTTVTSGGIDIVSKEGKAIDFLPLDAVPLNCVFEGTRLYIADLGQGHIDGEGSMVGRLLRIDAGIPGMPLFTGAIA